MGKLVDIEGIDKVYASRLQEAGVNNQEELLKQAAERRDRQALAKKTGISYKLILKWVNQADLARIHGVAEEYAELLERAGVDSVPELAQRNAENLHYTIQTVNDQHHLVRRLPGVKEVQNWITEAKILPRVVHH